MITSHVSSSSVYLGNPGPIADHHGLDRVQQTNINRVGMRTTCNDKGKWASDFEHQYKQSQNGIEPRQNELSLKVNETSDTFPYGLSKYRPLGRPPDEKGRSFEFEALRQALAVDVYGGAYLRTTVKIVENRDFFENHNFEIQRCWELLVLRKVQ